MPAEDNDLEEVITLATEPEIDPSAEPTDRGDNFTADAPTEDAPLNIDALKAVASEEPEAEPKADEAAGHQAEARIPKARFDEVNARMKQAEAERQALQEQLRALQAPQGQQPQAQPDLDAAEEAYLQALRDGDGTRAKQIRGAINTHIQQQAEAAAVARVSAVMDKRDTDTSLIAVANESIKNYPFLNSESEHANDEAIAEVVEWRDYYAAKGMRADVALQKAVAKIVPLYAPKAKEPEPEPKADPRGKESIQRNALAAAAQPAQLNGVGERASKARHDVAKMTEEEFDALPASERKRLRGDA